jgi:hypothetical protein
MKEVNDIYKIWLLDTSDPIGDIIMDQRIKQKEAELEAIMERSKANAEFHTRQAMFQYEQAKLKNKNDNMKVLVYTVLLSLSLITYLLIS